MVMMILRQIFFNNYYISLVQIKDFNALIDNKPFFDQPIKTNEKRMKKYTTGNLLDYLYHQKYY